VRSDRIIGRELVEEFALAGRRGGLAQLVLASVAARGRCINVGTCFEARWREHLSVRRE
jgi:hypothetical protein